MKMKIQVLYLTGTALLIGAAGVGDSITFDAVGSWTGAAILAVLMAAGGIVCWGYGRGLEIERAEKAHLRRCAQAALKEDIVVENQPDEDRARQSERDYKEQKRAFLKRAVMQQLGRKAGKGGLRILSETQMEEKAAAAMAQLQEDTWAKRISTP